MPRHRALPADDHRPRRSRARSDLRLRHHRFVAEKWGRRWITCDTSRVAITLAKQRLMTASYDYYELKYPHEGLKGGFIYETVPHVTLKSIANNPEIDEIYERLHPAIERRSTTLNAALARSRLRRRSRDRGGARASRRFRASKTVDSFGERARALLEWEVPFDLPEDWPAAARAPFDAFHEARQAMQRQMDASIAAHADQRCSTTSREWRRTSSASPVRSRSRRCPSRRCSRSTKRARRRRPTSRSRAPARSSRQHQWRDELLKTGIRGKGGQMLKFAALETLPDTALPPRSGHPRRHRRARRCELRPRARRAGAAAGRDGDARGRRPVPAPEDDRLLRLRLRPGGGQGHRPDQGHRGAQGADEHRPPDRGPEEGAVAATRASGSWASPTSTCASARTAATRSRSTASTTSTRCKGELSPAARARSRCGSLDTDYDERSLFPRQVFFPMAGAKDGWHKLSKDIRAELDEDALEEFHGTVSLPFEAGENKQGRGEDRRRPRHRVAQGHSAGLDRGTMPQPEVADPQLAARAARRSTGASERRHAGARARAPLGRLRDLRHPQQHDAHRAAGAGQPHPRAGGCLARGRAGPA